VSAAATSRLIQSLQNEALFDHPVSQFRVLETHISYVLLTGKYAYKIKKPVNFGFLDFSSLDQRKHFCQEELRLNQRLAASLYLDVIPISGSAENPVIGDTASAPIEYAIRMRQFDQQELLDGRQEAGQLDPDELVDLARQIAGFHASVPVVDPETSLGKPESVFAAMEDNFTHSRPLLEDDSLLPQLDALEAWTRCTFDRLASAIEERHTKGFVRECHGDLHLANITRFEGQITVFDCIEFNEPFRWIDVAKDLAFLLMDLESRGEFGLANRVLNTWLEYTGDYACLPLMPLYKAYRAMVRAKIALLTRTNTDLPDAERARLLESYKTYANLATHYCEIPNRYLLCTVGLSASGKSRVSGDLSAQLGLVRLRSDVERKRLFGLGPLDDSKSGQGEKLYTPEATEKTYDKLAELAGQLLACGQPVIVDAAFLRESERAKLEAVAEDQGVPFALIHCEAEESVRRERIRQRRNDASEATEDLLNAQKDWYEPITETEQHHTLTVDSCCDSSAPALGQAIRQHFGLINP